MKTPLGTLGTALLFCVFCSGAIAQQVAPAAPAKPFLLVEGWFDRDFTSDLYSFGMDGNLLKRLTSEPLPANHLVAVTPDGEHVLITHWSRDNPSRSDTARLLLVDLKKGTAQAVFDGGSSSYYQPVFAPDGKSLLAVREDFDSGRWSIVSLAWPAAKKPGVILTGPRGVSLSTPIFLADGKRFLFQQGDALARATLDGATVEALSGELDQKDRNWFPGLLDRVSPARDGWMPQVVTRYIARVEWRERENPAASPTADVVVIDVQTGQRTPVPMPSASVRVAVVVE